ncbi:hypothetical protein [Asticcacaulis excentricus]|uniref:DUF3990 domain-containing protein n=1 Tax=Asticcacaulis excentricus (strain ATCC 15261 / DSM 4724 / KCTC 12464 / NCIMB 9791 / VKM B-1370 / CB 48) TaxID=573065 RepID=E8RNG4_ASTEC|nr:hypothetical protein [Asticcacaulis excentricus]ADU11795.1 hypothetical protein Astex_0093 [Asticcacaulis excentricus CB 48]
MSRHATSFVLGYHGCRREVAARIIAGGLDLDHSDKDYDWLGSGAYFWESDFHRASEWAEFKFKSEAAVIGAVIDLGNCLDLVNRHDLEVVRAAHGKFLDFCTSTQSPVPQNLDLRADPHGDKLLRKLDCAVINFLNNSLDAYDKTTAYDTVRGMFVEGGALYDGSGFREKSHVQIAVRNNNVIKGYFVPRIA